MRSTPQYRADDHFNDETHPDAYNRPAFSALNRARRLLWNTTWAVFGRLSPRPLHGWRAFLLRSFGATLGPHCHVYPGARIWAPWNLHCEDHVAIADAAEVYNPSPAYLGSHSILSQGAYLCGATHDYNDAAFPLISFEIRVGAYAWVCARASVLPGVKIAEGAVLGLGAIASRDLESWTVYSGNPAQPVRARQRTTDSPRAASTSEVNAGS